MTKYSFPRLVAKSGRQNGIKKDVCVEKKQFTGGGNDWPCEMEV